jgi:hypothetical protein
MKLEINTNGSWKTILTGISAGDVERYRQAMTAAATLAELDEAIGLNRKPATWRLVDEGTGKVVSYCVGALGWTDRAA